MATPTTTGFLILGMLSERDWTAYELAEQIGKGVTEVWSRANRQLYNVPKRLVADGFASAHEEAVGRRTRTRYSITDAGRRELSEWLTTTPAPPALEFEGMVRVLVADDGTVDDLRSTLVAMGEHARSTRALFVAHARYMLDHDGGTHRERRHLMALANKFMVGHFTHIMEWSAWALAEIESWDDTIAPATNQVDDVSEVLRQAIAVGTSEPAAADDAGA